MAIKNIHEVKECPECASTNIVYNDSKQQVICQDCGLIYEPLAPALEEKFERVSGLINKVKNLMKRKKTEKKIKRKKKKKAKKKTRKTKKKK